MRDLQNHLNAFLRLLALIVQAIKSLNAQLANELAERMDKWANEIEEYERFRNGEMTEEEAVQYFQDHYS